jgi:hypothetical protein
MVPFVGSNMVWARQQLGLGCGYVGQACRDDALWRAPRAANTGLKLPKLTL